MPLEWIDENGDALKPGSMPADEVWGVRINGELFDEGDDIKYIYEDAFLGFNCEDLPEGYEFELVNYYDHNGQYEAGSLPFAITKAQGQLSISVMDFAWPRGRSQELDPFDCERLDITIRMLEELAKRENWLSGLKLETDDDYCNGGTTLSYSISVPANLPAEEAFSRLLARYEQITERVEALQGERSLSGLLASGDEELFTRAIVIPMLEKLGMGDVRYLHGADEHGRDVLYRYQHPLGFEVLGAVQCKAGDVSGRAGRQVDELLSQIQDSLAFPVYDLNAKSERPVAEVLVAISGDFTNHAVQRIRHRLQSPIANRVWFWSSRDFRDMARRLPKTLA